jgi:serine/threonine protein kinase
MTDEVPSFSGLLKRRGAFFGIWSTCDCEIIGYDLLIKRNETANKAERRIKLRPETQVIPLDDTQPRFQVVSPNDQPIMLAAPSKDVMMEWIVSLRAASLQYISMTMDAFNIISVIGRGSFGKVMLCEHRENRQLFAIKSVHKDRLIRSQQVHTVLFERKILGKISHPFIVALCFAFQTPTKFYLGLEYLPGGELFHHFRDKTKLDMEAARYYICEIALALDYLHSQGIVYRDLKPENILLGEDGYIKLTDFGLSKEIDCETATFCGTHEYMAPEIVRREPYGFKIDWWALGILSYELLFGKTPFANQNRSRMFGDIQSRAPTFPEHTDPNIVHFISGLLDKNPKTRFAFRQLAAEPFFRGVPFDDLLHKKVRMKFAPRVRNAKVPVHFDTQFTNESAMDSVGTPPPDAPDFDGFSFIETRGPAPLTPTPEPRLSESDSETIETAAPAGDQPEAVPQGQQVKPPDEVAPEP